MLSEWPGITHSHYLSHYLLSMGAGDSSCLLWTETQSGSVWDHVFRNLCILDCVITADLLMLNCVTTTTVKLTTVNYFSMLD